ncbi:MAG: DUF389 domain-containing protein [Lewinellaceae bacterium]|nr:DUF389 domain-containing protein [Lewinellaceae bacterium]
MEPLPLNDPQQGSGIRFHLRALWSAITEWFHDLLNLTDGLDREGTIFSIKSGKTIRGSNAWLLMASIMIASLGLDLNSPAVIIGAMLVSPLMNPILGVGLGVAINDQETLSISVRNFGIAITIALVTSVVYFLATPLGDLTDEIKARTAPTFLDGLVAIFGGLAGIISLTRKDKSNAIPGVAIATALMPPLCVSGYGIANGNWQIALNAFYLFFLNSFFIAIATFIIIRWLKFPLRAYQSREESRKVRNWLILFSLIIVIPSGFILNELYQERQVDVRIHDFIEARFGKEAQVQCLDYTLMRGDSSQQLVLELIGPNIPLDSIYKLEEQLHQLKGLENTKLSLLQDAGVDIGMVKGMQLELNNLGQVISSLDTITQERQKQKSQLTTLTKQIDSLQRRRLPLADLAKEVKVVFPDLAEMSLARLPKTDFVSPIRETPTLLIHWDRKKNAREYSKDESRLKEFVQLRSQLDTLILIRY